LTIRGVGIEGALFFVSSAVNISSFGQAEGGSTNTNVAVVVEETWSCHLGDQPRMGEGDYIIFLEEKKGQVMSTS